MPEQSRPLNLGEVLAQWRYRPISAANFETFAQEAHAAIVAECGEEAAGSIEGTRELMMFFLIMFHRTRMPGRGKRQTTFTWRENANEKSEKAEH